MAKMADFYGLVVQFCSSKCASHIIYCKKHTVRSVSTNICMCCVYVYHLVRVIPRHDDPATPARCTLFSLGWPPYCSDVEIEAVFSRAGSVTAIYLQASAGTVVKRVGYDSKCLLTCSYPTLCVFIDSNAAWNGWRESGICGVLTA